VLGLVPWPDLPSLSARHIEYKHPPQRREDAEKRKNHRAGLQPAMRSKIHYFGGPPDRLLYSSASLRDVHGCTSVAGAGMRKSDPLRRMYL